MKYKILFVWSFSILIASALGPANLMAASTCDQFAGSLPNPAAPEGKSNSNIPIEHIFVIMQENHSFDSYFGNLNQASFYGGQIDGLSQSLVNYSPSGTPVNPFHFTNETPMDPDHSWGGQHTDWNGGLNDQFVVQNTSSAQDGSPVMGFFNSDDLPYYYALANDFAVADRYFCSVLGPTFPNRMYMINATSYGHVKNEIMSPPLGVKMKTIFDELDANKISWTYYFGDAPFAMMAMPTFFLEHMTHFKNALLFAADVQGNKLPQVIFVDPNFVGGDEHPPADIQIGQYLTSQRVNAVMQSPNWPTSAIFLTYDENGGFYDHVAPPEACSPDSIPANSGDADGFTTFDHAGFRVPFTLVSPFAKRHYVSHATYDHTSVLKFIETKFNLPALTNRDANADAMLDLFDFASPNYTLPVLPTAAVALAKVEAYNKTAVLNFLEAKFSLPPLMICDEKAKDMMELFDVEDDDSNLAELPPPVIDATQVGQCVIP